MSVMAQLATIFTVDNSQFKKGLRDNEKRARGSSRSIVGHTKSMARSFRGTVNSVFNLRTAVATLAGSAGIGLLVKNELDAIDKSAKFARMVGASTRELTGLQHAAEISSGVVGTEFNMAIQRMSRRIAEAAKGTGEAKDAIKDLGLDAKELAKSGPGEAFKQIAEAIKQVENPAQRLRIGFKLFDSEGAKLVNTLNLGREGIEKLQAEADKLGITFSEFDASQVEMANDAINRMQKAFKASTTQLTIKLAPIITAVADKITEMSVQSDGLSGSLKTAGSVAVGAFKAMADGIHTVKILFQGVKVVALGFSSLVLNIADKWLGAWSSVMDFFIDKINFVIKKFNQIPGGPKVPLIPNVNKEGFISDINDMASVSIGALKDAKQKMHEMGMEQIPSESIDKFIADVQKKTAQAREAAASGMTGGDSSSGDDSGVDKQEKKARERKLEMIRQSMMTEMNLERQQFEKKIEFLEETDETLFEHERGKRGFIEDLERQHQERLNEISANGQSQMLQQNIQFLRRIEKARASSGAAQVNIATDALQQMTAASATESKRMFKINKAAGIANAIISTYQGAAKALSMGPWGIPLAAIVIAAGLAQVQKIKSQQFQGGGAGGGGGAVAPSVGATPAPPVTPVNNQGVSDVGRDESRSSLQIFISGPVDRQYLKDALLPAMQEEINENDVTFINANSAQARELNRA